MTRLLPLLIYLPAAALLAWCVVRLAGEDYYLASTTAACQISGYAAIGFLAAAVLAGPIFNAVRFVAGSRKRERTNSNGPRPFDAADQTLASSATNQTLASSATGELRIRISRHAGAAAAMLATAHATISWWYYLEGAVQAFITWPYLRSGGAGLAVLWVLAATSSPTLVRLLRIKLWKPLHRAVYLLPLLILHHLLLAPFAQRGWILFLLACAVAVWLLRFLPGNKPPKASAAASEKTLAERG